MTFNTLSLCIQCQGSGYNKFNNFYVKCVLCKGTLFIKKIKIANILGKGNCSNNFRKIYQGEEDECEDEGEGGG